MTTITFLRPSSDSSVARPTVSVRDVEGQPQLDEGHRAAEAKSGWRHRLRHVIAHDHDHGQNPIDRDTKEEGIRATKVSLLGQGSNRVTW